MSIHAIPAASITATHGWWRARYETAAFVAPVVIFFLMATQRGISFVQTGNPIVLVNGAALVLIMMAFLVRGEAKTVDRSFGAWLAAVLGDFAPFALDLRHESYWAGPVPFIMQCAALGLFCWAVKNIWSSIGVVPANRGIKVSGPYRFIRHPMYTAVVLSEVAMAMVFLSPINVVMLFVVTAFKAKMIANAERLLRQDPEYQAYAARVRWRAIPGFI